MNTSSGPREIGLLPVLVMFWLLFSGTTWHVTYDPNEPEDRIGATVAGANSGDTIVVDPGIYYEHIDLSGKSLSIIGTGGASETVLDGGRSFEGREGSIIYTSDGVGAALSLRGLTFQNGTGAPFGSYDGLAGGAILWWCETGTSGRLTIRECVFEWNTTGDPGNLYAVGGGAVFASLLSEGVEILDSVFANNTSNTRGGDLYIDDYGIEECIVEGCQFEVGITAWNDGASIYLKGSAAAVIRGNRFHAASGDGQRSCISADGPSSVDLIENEFIDLDGILATAVHLGFFGVGAPPQRVRALGNLFWHQAGPDSNAAASFIVAMPNGEFEIADNTFLRCGVDVQNHAGAPQIKFRNNIVAGGKAVFFIPSGGVVECNDFWQASLVDHIGNLHLSRNLEEDPLFCGERTGDLRIATQSPCAEENSPEGCGLIGALPAECDLTPVERISWGAIKAGYK